MAADIPAGRMQTSLRVTSDLTRSFADIRAQLSTIVPGAQLPETLFSLVEVAWSQFVIAMNRGR